MPIVLKMQTLLSGGILTLFRYQHPFHLSHHQFCPGHFLFALAAAFELADFACFASSFSSSSYFCLYASLPGETE